ncbi:PadR family transcriptional regulator [Alicyclobacillus kakegawensis]|uniref:PadR family transcriptional regulator n=1 Tax=Alicyclobacillus kakegawensis TaxID=392012 RepID=UPI000831B6FC|nr:PadR family transcriptional regulator [Alicyclobacillus kakegawensis]
MYELFVLGELWDKPLHGYLLKNILSNQLGRQVSFGVLYPALRKLASDGFIREHTEEHRAETGRPRKVYSITDRGRQRFAELMDEPIEPGPDAEIVFRIKLSKFGYVEADVRLKVLRNYHDCLEQELDRVTYCQRFIESHPDISDRERPYVLRAIAHQIHIVRADLAWVEDEIVHTESDAARARD